MALAKKPFVVLDAEILSSSVWSEAAPVRLVWITLLILCDTEGYVGASVPGIASAAGVSLQEAEEAMKRLQEPDKYSRTQANEGRRLEVTERGWRVLNFIEHLNRLSSERAKARDRMWRHRQRKKQQRDATPKRRRTTTVTSPSLQGVGSREQGIGITTEVRISPSADSSPPPWSREASDDWTASKGGPPPDLIFRALKTAVTAHGWPTVRPVWQFYLAATAAEFVNVPKFTASFGEWAARAKGHPAPGGAKQTASESTLAAAARVLERHEGRRT